MARALARSGTACLPGSAFRSGICLRSSSMTVGCCLERWQGLLLQALRRAGAEGEVRGSHSESGDLGRPGRAGVGRVPTGAHVPHGTDRSRVRRLHGRDAASRAAAQGQAPASARSHQPSGRARLALACASSLGISCRLAIRNWEAVIEAALARRFGGSNGCGRRGWTRSPGARPTARASSIRFSEALPGLSAFSIPPNEPSLATSTSPAWLRPGFGASDRFVVAPGQESDGHFPHAHGPKRSSALALLQSRARGLGERPAHAVPAGRDQVAALFSARMKHPLAAQCRLQANICMASDSSHLLLSCPTPLLLSTTGRTSPQVRRRTCRAGASSVNIPGNIFA